MSMTRAVGLPEAKLRIFSCEDRVESKGYKRSEDTVSGKPEGGTGPVLHGDLDSLFSIFACVPAGFGHEERVLAQRLFLLFHSFHCDVLGRVIETVRGEWCRLCVGES